MPLLVKAPSMTLTLDSCQNLDEYMTEEKENKNFVKQFNIEQEGQILPMAFTKLQYQMIKK